ncbi:MAG TPA: hypothetical protein VNM48_03825 [Chloroflexota bacterium]|nr:hypothetical protein [Chloroflexota bacterium]
MTTWTDPSDAGPLDLASGTIVTETHWDNMRRDLLFLGGPTGSRACRAYHSAIQSIPHATPTALALNSERFDTDAIHDTAINNSRLTCKTAGKYSIIGHVEWSANATGVRQLRLVLNGVTSLVIVAVTTPVGAGYQGIATIADLVVNDYVELQAYQDSGGALTVSNAAQYGCEFMMAKIG